MAHLVGFLSSRVFIEGGGGSRKSQGTQSMFGRWRKEPKPGDAGNIRRL